MKTYIYSFVAVVRGEKIVKDIRSEVPDDVGIVGIKDHFAMALEQEHDCPFRCVRVEEVEE